MRLRTGVAGAGVFGAFHARKHRDHAASDLVGVFDASPDAAHALAAETCCSPFRNYELMLEGVDAVVIATPASSHRMLAELALAAGKHVYVEKPIALALRDADALIDLADRRGLVLQVGHQERFVLAGLGLPRREAAPIRLECLRQGPPTGRGLDVSVVVDLMIHDLDIARLFGFAEPIETVACGDRDETIATLAFAEGRTASFIANRRAGQRRRLMKAVFEEGEIEIDFLKRTVRDTTGPGEVIGKNHPAFDDPLGASIAAFVAAALDRTPPAVDGRTGRGALSLALKVEAAREEIEAMAAPLRRKTA